MVYKIIPNLCLFVLASVLVNAQQKAPEFGDLEIVAELDITPGNVAISPKGRIFASVHPLRRGKFQLIEITGKYSYEPFPNKSWNASPGSSQNVMNSPLGVVVDGQNRIWVIDSGNALEKPLTPKLLAFDIESRALVYRYDFPENIAPKGSFVQDLVVDTDNHYIYMADLGGEGIAPAILSLNYKTNEVFRFENDKLLPEDIDMVIDGEARQFFGNPARVGVNPITLSADNETLYFAAMSGTKFYTAPARLFRKKSASEQIDKSIRIIGAKSISDGSTIDQKGNLYITNLGNHSIDRLSQDGKSQVVVKDDQLLDWPDNIRLSANGWAYIAINQLHKTQAFTGGEDLGTPPYRILRVFVGEKAVWGR